MSKLTPAMIQELSRVAQAAQEAPQGGKQAVYADACERLGISLATLHRYLGQITVRAPRKRRSDHGDFALSHQEAEAISAYMLRHWRGNGKQGITLKQALADLRGNDLIRAEAIDAATGELRPISEGAVARALRARGLHPEQLRRASVAVPQSSPHANHTWQMDASLCTIFYLDDDGAAAMPEQVFYKNRLDNFERVAKKRVTRFVMTDHCTGSVKVRYFFGGESEAAFVEFFLWSIQRQDGSAVHGVPLQLMVDPGSGMAQGFKNLLRRLGVRLIVNAPGNPRAKGQVENAQNLVEMGFEHQFRAHRPASLAELNERAERWARNFNATQIHTRHGKTRVMKWMEITPEQLRIAPSVERCRELLTAQPKPCLVDQYNQVRFGGNGRRWNVATVPGVMVGEKVEIAPNPYNDREVFAVFHDAEGMEVLHPCPLVEMDENGFQAGARQIGAGYRALPETAADQARKKAELLATGADTLKDAARAVKKGEEVFNGRVRFDYLDREVEAQAALLPRRGTPLTPAVAVAGATTRVLSQFEAAAALAAKGVAMSRELVTTLCNLHPEGVPEDQLPALAERLTVRAGLRVVAGGAQ